MKKTLIIILFSIFLCFPFYSQEMRFVIKESLELIIDFDKKEFIIEEVFIDECNGSDILSIHSQIKYSGQIIINKSLIKCVDENTEKMFFLKKMRDYIYIVVNNTKYLQKNRIIYAHTYISKDKSLIIDMKWVNGKKNGDWLYIDKKKENAYIIVYKENVAVERKELKNKEIPVWKIK